MTCHHGPGIVICDGITGGWMLTHTRCPWCCVKGERVVVAMREIYSGYVAPDMACGECGHRWNGEASDSSKDTPEERREEAIAIVKGILNTLTKRRK